MHAPLVVYIHGFNSSSTIFNYLISELPEHEFLKVEYDSSRSFDRIVEDIRQVLPNRKIFLIGHSLGGLIACHLANTNMNVVGLITISSPFGGHESATLASFFYPRIKIFRDLNPFGSLIKRLKRFKPPVEWLNIISTAGHLPITLGENDSVVPIASQEACQASTTMYISSNHFEVMQHPALVKAIRANLFMT